jgi:SRSO17 transposase
MTAEELDRWADHFTAFHARFADLFDRSEPREQARKYLRGLLSAAERKNGWQLAEIVGDSTPDRTQRLLYAACWDADAARDRLIDFVIERFGEADGIGVLDETGFLKKGIESVGVQRQYTGTAGKVDNAQVGTFLSYVSSKGHVLVDRRLFLPKSWADAPLRREKAHVPKETAFQTKPEQALDMLRHAWARGVPMRYVTGDEVYGNASALRSAITEAQRRYVLAVSSTTPVWREPPVLEVPGAPPIGRRRGRPRKKVRLDEQAPPASPVAEIAARWRTWERLVVGQGEKGPISYDWACARVIESQQGLPGRAVYLLVRRSVSDPEEKAYYLSNAPEETPLVEMAQVAARRYSIEQCFEEAKGEAGLDQYEVRTWPSWHRHITLSMMAHAFLASIRTIETEKKTRPRSQPMNWPR